MGEGKTLQLRMGAFNVFNHPLVSFNNNDTNNLNLGFQDAIVGQALTQTCSSSRTLALRISRSETGWSSGSEVYVLRICRKSFRLGPQGFRR